MDGRHQLALGGEWDLVHPRKALAERVRAEAGLARGDEQGTLRRIALHDPSPLLLRDLRVVRAIGRGERAIELRAKQPDYRTATLNARFAVRGVACSREVDPPTRDDHGAHRHLVPRQRTRLVR